MMANKTRFAASQTKAYIKSKIPQSTIPNAVLQPIRVPVNSHPIHPLAFLRQSRSQHRWFSTGIRNFTSNSKHRNAGRYDRSSFPVTKTSKVIARRGAAPFASTLRPNLTGGALPRSVGGYSLGGTGVRHFSHTPGVQAQVVHNVSAGIRAFFVNGGKAKFDGFDSETGEKRFKAVSRTENEVFQKIEAPFKATAKGTNLDFQLSPTITAFSSIYAGFDSQHLNTPSLLGTLSADFARALTDLSVVLTDLNHLATLGELPLSLKTTSSGPVITLRFPGCDANIVSRLCEEAGVRRGIIREDEAWNQDRDVEMALLFPFAPTANQDVRSEGATYFEREPAVPEQVDWRHMMSPHDAVASSGSPLGKKVPLPRDHLTSPSGYESLCDGDFAVGDEVFLSDDEMASAWSPGRGGSSQGYEGLEGIYRFLRECEDARR